MNSQLKKAAIYLGTTCTAVVMIAALAHGQVTKINGSAIHVMLHDENSPTEKLNMQVKQLTEQLNKQQAQLDAQNKTIQINAFKLIGLQGNVKTDETKIQQLSDALTAQTNALNAQANTLNAQAAAQSKLRSDFQNHTHFVHMPLGLSQTKDHVPQYKYVIVNSSNAFTATSGPPVTP